MTRRGGATALADLRVPIESCTACPRLVAWRNEAGDNPPRRFAGQDYWRRPVAGFGDPAARIALVGLAPAAHGANRTGRIFTGDRSGDWLYEALFRCGMANQPHSTARDDGLELSDVFVTAVVRCAPPANRPLPIERDRCMPYLAGELKALTCLRAIVALGGFAWENTLRTLAAIGSPAIRPRPRFGHGAEAAIGELTLLGCFHPSQQNTFTGRLTEPMTDGVLQRAKEIAAAPRTTS